jgi:hypothetical protein
MQLKPIFKMVKIPSVLFSANKELILIIKKVASGGEMSRITAVKAILAKYSKLPTLIFDEIDTGVLEKLLLEWEKS